MKKVCVLSNFHPDTKQIWNKMSDHSFTLVSPEEAEYFVIVNALRSLPTNLNPKKTIVFQMEPDIQNPEHWGPWATPEKIAPFHAVVSPFTAPFYHNVPDWHLSLSYDALFEHPKKMYSKTVATVLSDKNFDPGHKKRLKFAEYLDTSDVPVHIYGTCSSFGFRHYLGPLPERKKDEGVLPYKYIFNAENNDIPGYFTEKITDGILGECLVFYWGCSNLESFIDEDAFVRIDCEREDVRKVHEVIEKEGWEYRIELIRKEKEKVLRELTFFPMVKKAFGF